MGFLAWLLAVAGLGGASLFFATSAPGPAWWVLGLVVAGLLAGPHLAQWWHRRSRRTERLAARWRDAHPAPADVAFLCGGPDRVVDLVVADLVVEGRLTVDKDGRLAPAAPAAGTDEAVTPPEAAIRREIHTRLSAGTTDVAALRFATRPTEAIPPLWRTAARQRLILPAWRREFTPWLLAGAGAAIGYGAAVALGRAYRPELTFWAGVGALALGVLALWRTRFLIGYGFDPRTAAGLRAVQLAHAAAWPENHRYRTALHGIRSASDLRPGAPDPHRVPLSQWHVPWYARRIREPNASWRTEAAQSPADHPAPPDHP